MQFWYSLVISSNLNLAVCHLRDLRLQLLCGSRLTSAANLPLPQSLHDGSDSWLGGSEAQPVKTQGNPMVIRKQWKNWRYVSDDRENGI